MGELYDLIKWCESQPTWLCALRDSVAPVVLRTSRDAYGGPLFEYYACPPGDRPPPPQAVHASLAQQDWYAERVDAAGDQDIRAYLVEQFELADNAWRSRVEWCTQKEAPAPPPPPPGEPPPPPGNGEPPKGAVPAPKDDDNMIHNAAIAALAVGALLLFLRSRS